MKATKQTSVMENCNVPVHQQDHDYPRERRISTRQKEGAKKPRASSKCPCCRDPNPKQQHTAAPANPPQERKRTSRAYPSKPSGDHKEMLDLVSIPRPSTSAAEHPGVLNLVPTLQPSSLTAELPGLLKLVPNPRSTISRADLSGFSNVAHSPQPSNAPLNNDGPLKIHNCSVEEYQQIYHEVVDDMLRYKNGRLRPYSLELGCRIKQKLWERLDCPRIRSANENGLVHVDIQYRVGAYPPLYDVDTSGEPQPGKPPNKRARK